jgi:cAMP-dependent protein kinase regulator
VSAESLAPQTNQVRRTSSGPAKTAEQEARILSALGSNILFKNLDPEQTRDVIDAMTEKKVPKEGVVVIRQGDVGDFYYIVEEGSVDFFIRPAGAAGHGLGDKVGTAGAGGSFGELALMYNAPRAASVVSTSRGVLWALDRITFRRILMDVTPALPCATNAAHFPQTENVREFSFHGTVVSGSQSLGKSQDRRRTRDGNF